MSIYNKLQEFASDLTAKEVTITKEEIEADDGTTVEAFNQLYRYGLPEERYHKEVVDEGYHIVRLNPNDPDERHPPDDLHSRIIDDPKELAAMLSHEANRAHCEAVGDKSQKPWAEAPDWQKDSARNGVEFVWPGDTTPEQSHENWMKQKIADGWKFGSKKDPEKKTHPCMVPYSQLPEEQRVKDTIFRSVVLAVKALA